MSSVVNVAAPGVPFFTPAQDPPAGSAIVPQPDGTPIPLLFQPLTIRDVTFQNRIFVAPMCQYSAKDGLAAPWHVAHLGGLVTHGPGLTIVEASGVVPRGRITPECLGIWSDAHVAAFKPIVEYAHSQNQKIGIQLAHAGRKASTIAPWLTGSQIAGTDVGGWPDDCVGPSAIPYTDGFPMPREMSVAEIKEAVEAFAAASMRAVRAGFDVIEIHGAHGYLLSSFMSPTSNKRTDDYGGSFENRIRFALEVVDAVRTVIPSTMPLFFRISGTEGLEQSLPNQPSWSITDTVRLAPILAAHGIDFLDVSAGGNHPQQRFSTGPAYQAPLAHAVKSSSPPPNLLVGTVGGINDGHIAQNVLDRGEADTVLVARAFLRHSALAWSFAEDLGVLSVLPHQIRWGFRGRGKNPAKTKEALEMAAFVAGAQ